MKILHIGLCATGLPYNGLQTSLIRQSSEYREINSGIKNLNEEIAVAVRDWTPDLCFIQIQRAGILTEATAQLLKSKCFTVNWTGDIRVPTPAWYCEIGKLINLTLFTNIDDVLALREAGIRADYLDIGINPDIYTPVGDKMNVPEIVFFANNYHEKFPMSRYRRELVAFMQTNFGDRFGVYGSGWINGNGSFMGNQSREASAYRGAKIGINCSNIEANRYSSDRILRLMASGAMCLTKWYPDIQLDYNNHEHLEVWHDFDGLKVLCDKYLSDDSERERISKAGCEFIHQTKTFDRMIQGLITLYYHYK